MYGLWLCASVYECVSMAVACVGNARNLIVATRRCCVATSLSLTILILDQNFTERFVIEYIRNFKDLQLVILICCLP